MRKSKFRVLPYLLMLVLLVSMITGCGNKDKATDNTAATTTPAVSATPAVTQAPVGIATKDDGTMRADLTATELTKLMGNGINLGNTMEACDKSAGVRADVSAYETSWGQPVTTQAMIDGMKVAGFDSLRIPVAWVTNSMNGFANGDYTINKAYLDRVEEIANYALNDGMYVIINDHWDGSWWGMFGSATKATSDAAMQIYTSMWTQIADRFKNYSDHVILESANEELGDRLNDKNYAADSGTLSTDQCYQMNTKINQAFVDTVRGTGGNNAQRFLLIAAYNTDIDKTCDDRFVMPTDTAKSKLLLSCHYYTPWGYAGTSSLSSWGSLKNYNEMNDNMAKLKKFTDEGYGVVIGEYMVALNQDGSVKDNATDFFNNLLDNCDMYDYVPMLWDCSTLFTRSGDMTIFDKDVANVYKSHSLSMQSDMAYEDIQANAKLRIDKAVANAKDTDETAAVPSTDGKAIAWIMINDGAWAVEYSVGNTYNPSDKSKGLVPTDVEITGAGTYTVSLDFTGTGQGYANGLAFSALGISNGETLFPGYIINITDVKINGESYTLKGKPYTTADDQICTRVNLYNNWVTKIPDDARTADGDVKDVTANIIDPNCGNIKTLSVTFDYEPAK